MATPKNIVGRSNTPVGCRSCCCANCSPETPTSKRQWDDSTGVKRCAVCQKPALEWVATVTSPQSTHPKGWTGWVLLPFGTDDFSETVHPLRPVHPAMKPSDDGVFEVPDTRLNVPAVDTAAIVDLQKQLDQLRADIRTLDSGWHAANNSLVDLGNLMNTHASEITQLKADYVAMGSDLGNRVATLGQSLTDDLKRIEQSIAKNAPLEINIGAGKARKTKNLGRVHADLANMIVMTEAIGDSGIIYAVGEASSGKSTAQHILADALDLELYSYTFHQGVSDMDVLGYYDVTGRYVKTLFREAYVGGSKGKGALMSMDEFSRTSEAGAAMVNGMTANAKTAFPDGIQTRHDRTRFVAWGNTFGRDAQGMDGIDYIGTSQLDPATLTRCCYVPFNTDWELLGDAFGTPIKGDPPKFPPPGKPRSLNDPLVQGWGQRIKDIRDIVQELRLEASIGGRAYINGLKFLLAGIDVGLVYWSVVWMHMSQDDAETIRSRLGIDERGEPSNDPRDEEPFSANTDLHARIGDSIHCHHCGEDWYVHCVHCLKVHTPDGHRSSRVSERPSSVEEALQMCYWSVCQDCVVANANGYNGYKAGLTNDEFDAKWKAHWA